MIDAEYAEGSDASPYINLQTETPIESNTLDDFQLDASKVCRIDDPDCEACQ